MFFSFEGGEGSGKSSLIKKLKNKLEVSLKQTIITIREPGTTIIGEQIRNILLNIKNTNMSFYTEALLMAASRAQLIEEIIIPFRNKKIILCDRYIDSSFAYQGFGRNLGIHFIEKINFTALENMPDLTFYIDIKPEIGQERIMKNRSYKQDRLDKEKNIFHQKVRQGFLFLAKKFPERIIMIDGNQTLDYILDYIFSIIIKKLKI